MKNVNKYERQYFMPPVCEYDWAKKDHIEKAPVWCSVDLRDGNQALIYLRPHHLRGHRLPGDSGRVEQEIPL